MNTSAPFFALLAYAFICQFIVVTCLIRHHVPVPWLTLAVPLHLFQRCRESRTRLGPALQWWSLSADFAVVGCLAIVFVAQLQRG